MLVDHTIYRNTPGGPTFARIKTLCEGEWRRRNPIAGPSPLVYPPSKLVRKNGGGQLRAREAAGGEMRASARPRRRYRRPALFFTSVLALLVY